MQGKMTTIVTNIGLMIQNPYSIVVLAVLSLCFRDLLADMFCSVFSFTKSFLCVAYRLAMLFCGVMLCMFAIAFGQTMLHLSDKLISVLFISLLIILLDTIVSFGKKILLVVFGVRGKATAERRVLDFNEKDQVADIPVTSERVFRLIQ